ncbi:MAG: hypothetical protein QOJ29_2242 [Thermoleophilaceae bacterium]|jgi:predicted MPP superfamily phosphohydrolase|nr:hypothetical protein [Thermoleophilaceae bacterium]
MSTLEDKAYLVNVLHLSDLHFEIDASQSKRDQRRTANETLIAKICEVLQEPGVTANSHLSRRREDDWRPDVVAISGDIAYTGDKKEYKAAQAFLAELRTRLGLEPEDVVMCPGNHDRNVRNAKGLGYPRDAKQSDEWLSPESLAPLGDPQQLRPLVVPFVDFRDFCESVQAIAPDGLDGLKYLTGRCTKQVRNVALEFTVINSAWFSEPGAGDMRNMWLGLQLIEAMRVSAESEANATHPNGVKRLRVGLCHHTREWLHQEEHDSYSDRPNTFRLLAQSCDILLHGHVHGALEPPTRAHNGAQSFTGGASYASGRYRNNFSLLQVNLDDQSVRRRGFEYDPRTFVWEEIETAKGTFQLPANDSMEPPEPGPHDLTGAWRSVYWQEALPSVRKTYDDLRLIQVELDPPTFETEGSGDDSIFSPLKIRGELSPEGYLTGRWWDVEDEVYGAFQLKVVGGGDRIVGRWLGFYKDEEIAVGYWRFSRRSEESADGRAIVDPAQT